MKKILALLLSATLLSTTFPTITAGAVSTYSAVNAARQVEYLTRGSYGVVVSDGVYLSWRLLGTEPIDRTFDVYRNNVYIAAGIDSLNYLDKDGSINDSYVVVPHGESLIDAKAFKPYAKDYLDVMLDKPQSNSTDYSYIANDASVGDVDNDGEYELIVKWDPSDCKDNELSLIHI